MSRREAEQAIRDRRIFMNGTLVRELGTQMDPAKDKIEVRGMKQGAANKITVAVNKPRGIVSSNNPEEGKTIFELLPKYNYLNVVGRLDKESDGLLLLSNDGRITAAITGPKHELEKEYEVGVRETLRPMHIEQMRRGIRLSDGTTLPAEAERLNMHTFQIILREGRNHQIRRMADALHLTITGLRRVRIGNITLGGLRTGGSRELNDKEIRSLLYPRR